jgi:hypothetical protein
MKAQLQTQSSSQKSGDSNNSYDRVAEAIEAWKNADAAARDQAEKSRNMAEQERNDALDARNDALLQLLKEQALRIANEEACEELRSQK